MIYCPPARPYVIQSGKHAGQSPDVLMFKDYRFLDWLLRKIRDSAHGNTKNRLHHHLEWLFDQGENRVPTMLCPHCLRNPVTFFSLMCNVYTGGISVSEKYTCCSNEECRGMIEDLASGHSYTLHPFKFSIFARLESDSDQKDLMRVYRRAFKMPSRISREIAFKFFNK